VIADYETLIRLARRCAYDFKHASDYIPTEERPKINWLSGINWGQRATMWTDLFAKGNPGKDYRQDLVRDLDMATMAVESMMEVMKENGLEDKIPAHIVDRYTKMPF
jgi:hypothetical protein